MSEFLDKLYNERGLSLSDISRLTGNRTSGYASWLCGGLGVQVRPLKRLG